ncbi:MAG: hypothetical protein OXF31_12270 [Gammaproteobacteria bacterium]|nr:hypothetical protein [Gammaproteobacteria bacterium]
MVKRVASNAWMGSSPNLALSGHFLPAMLGKNWILAGLQLPARWKWPDVRAEVNVKERYFEALAEELGVAGAPGGGRKPLGEEASRNISAVRYKCPEDFDTLARRIEALHSS